MSNPEGREVMWRHDVPERLHLVSPAGRGVPPPGTRGPARIHLRRLAQTTSTPRSRRRVRSRVRATRSSANCSRRAGVPYREPGMAMRPLTTRSRVTPGSTRLSRSKLRMRSAEPETSTTVAAISATISRLRRRAVRTDVPAPDEPSRSASLTRTVETERAGTTPGEDRGQAGGEHGREQHAATQPDVVQEGRLRRGHGHQRPA